MSRCLSPRCTVARESVRRLESSRAFPRLVRRAFFVPRDPAVDVGCGTGRWTRELAACGLATPGVDVAPIMVARAQELAPGLSFDVASATELPFADGSQQLVACITV